MLKTIYFDLGNVLCFFDLQKMYDQIAKCCGFSIESVKQILLDHQLQQSHELGKIDSEGIYRFFKSRSSRQFSFRELTEALSDIFTPNKALWPTVELLKKEGMRLILISNTCESHYNRVYSHYPVLRLFDHKILSFEIGALKPDARIFQKALSLSECSPAECFYTDDIPAFVAGARKAGLDSEIYTDVSSLKKHLIDRGCGFLA